MTLVEYQHRFIFKPGRHRYLSMMLIPGESASARKVLRLATIYSVPLSMLLLNAPVRKAVPVAFSHPNVATIISLWIKRRPK
jgi:hypothetical protein